MTAIEIATATPEDAEAALFVLRESIRKLCIADHRNDEETLKSWLHNKTTENFCQWVAYPESLLVVARVDSAVRGVGSVHTSGSIMLCYVQPGFERIGVGGAILRHLEKQARTWGIARLVTHSSLTALGFYERHGYLPDGDAIAGFGISKAYPYAKRLGE
jgi:GNAT superfamily N-acetyltransferase